MKTTIPYLILLAFWSCSGKEAPQDIGRFLLNRINNAFQAVYEKAKATMHRSFILGITTLSLLGASPLFLPAQQIDYIKPRKVIGKASPGQRYPDSLITITVTPITAANAPKVVTAGKPTRTTNPHPQGLGAPVFQKFPGTECRLMFQDSRGFLWFRGSVGSINRYDGHNFVNYGPIRDDVYPEAIEEDPSGNLWFATKNGAFRFDGIAFDRYAREHGLLSDTIHSIYQDKQGRLLFGTESGISVLKLPKNTTASPSFETFDPSLRGTSVYSVLEDERGTLWIGTGNSGLLKREANNWQHFGPEAGIPDSPIRGLVMDGQGAIWFWSRELLFRFDGQRSGPYSFQGSNVMRDILKDDQGDVWFATHGAGLYKYDGHSWMNYGTQEGLQMPLVLSVSQDKQGNLWTGSYRGMSKLGKEDITTYHHQQGISNANIYSLIQDREGNYWLGSMDGGLYHYDGRIFSNYSLEQGLADNQIRRLYEDKAGRIWIGTEAHGVVMFDGRSFVNYTPEQGLHGSNVLGITQDSQGNMWFGGLGGGITKFDGKNMTSYALAFHRGGGTWTMHEDKEKRLWASTNTRRLICIADDQFFTYTKEDGLASGNIFGMAEDQHGNLWFPTANGLSCYDGDRFISFYGKNALGVGAIALDTIHDRLWLGGSGLTIAQVFYNASGYPDSVHFEYYNEQDGFPVKYLNPNALLVDKQGIGWVGHFDLNLLRVDYDLLTASKAPSPVRIKSVLLNNEKIIWNYLRQASNRQIDQSALEAETRISFQDTVPEDYWGHLDADYGSVRFDSLQAFDPVPYDLTLPYAANNITFEFGVIEPSDAAAVQFQHQLEGYDKDWSRLGRQTSAHYTNMWEGTYTFRVKALNRYDLWSETSYTFRILPPWYRSWWAYLAYLLSGLLILYAFVRWRTRQLQSEKQQLEVKVSERTRELKSSLDNLQATQTQLIQQEKLASLGQLTAGIAHEIKNPLNFVNNFSEVSQELLEEMRAEIKKGDWAEVEAIAGDLELNLTKIHQHGSRADGIVQSMLLHSRGGRGVAEPADLNAFVSEYVNLAYHGMRAGKEPIPVKIDLNQDDSIGKIPLVAEDLSRVILNLCSNAFDAMRDKLKQADDYQPKLSIRTQQHDGEVSIEIEDNGPGIPEAIRDKILQPFFTTKKGTEGTGLGLSISNDIVKAHGGTLKVETKENEGSAFIIWLPLNG